MENRVLLLIFILISLSAFMFSQGESNPENKKEEPAMFKGIYTAIYYVDDLKTGTEWYTSILGFKPYYEDSYYVGFNVNGYELGLSPITDEISQGNNHIAYWGVDDIQKVLKHLVDKGASIKQEVFDVGENILTASVTDPFGNVFGLIQNPHFKAGK